MYRYLKAISFKMNKCINIKQGGFPMANELYLIKNKIPDLSYAFTLNGVELPVLDTTHPLSFSSIDDIKTVDAGTIAALKISTGIKPRFLGIEDLKHIINKNKWKLDSLIEGNPRYLIFALKKELLK